MLKLKNGTCIDVAKLETVFENTPYITLNHIAEESIDTDGYQLWAWGNYDHQSRLQLFAKNFDKSRWNYDDPISEFECEWHESNFEGDDYTYNDYVSNVEEQFSNFVKGLSEAIGVEITDDDMYQPENESVREFVEDWYPFDLNDFRIYTGYDVCDENEESEIALDITVPVYDDNGYCVAEERFISYVPIDTFCKLSKGKQRRKDEIAFIIDNEHAYVHDNLCERCEGVPENHVLVCRPEDISYEVMDGGWCYIPEWIDLEPNGLRIENTKSELVWFRSDDTYTEIGYDDEF